MRHVLVKIAEIITQHPRYLPVITWSDKSWTHNAFRFWELCFGRRFGIRTEASTCVRKDENGYITVTRSFFTIEALIAHIETNVRQIRFRSISINPIYGRAILNLFGYQRVFIAGNGLANNFGYRFAVGFDVASSSFSASASSLTYSHTSTGSNLMLVTGGGERNAGTTNTYNAVSCTALTSRTNGAANARQWYLSGPATGANNVVTTFGTSAYSTSITTTFTGVDSTIGTEAGGTGSSTSVSTVVTSATNELVVDYVSHGVATSMTIGAGQTLRGSQVINANTQAVSTEPGAASVTMSWTTGVSSVWAHTAFPMKPASTSTYNESRRMHMMMM